MMYRSKGDGLNLTLFSPQSPPRQAIDNDQSFSADLKGGRLRMDFHYRVIETCARA